MKRPELTYKSCNFSLRVADDLETKELRPSYRYTPCESDETCQLTFGTLLRGYASTPDLDSVEDEIAPGAFEDSIETFFVKHSEIYGAPFIKVLYNHEPLTAVLHYIEETEQGLYVEFWCLNTTAGRDFYVAVASGAVNQMSIGFIPMETEDKKDEKGKLVKAANGKKIRIIKKCWLFEVSGVLWPANYATSLGKSRELDEILINILLTAKSTQDSLTLNSSENTQEEPEPMDIVDMCKSAIKQCAEVMSDDKKLTKKEFKMLYRASGMMSSLAWTSEMEEEAESDDEVKSMRNHLAGFVQKNHRPEVNAGENSVVDKPPANVGDKSDPRLSEMKDLLAGITKIPVSGKEN